MRISRKRRFYKPQVEQPLYKANEKITAPELVVIDEGGVNLGVMETAKALDMARERGLDLVEISPKANPPVGKFLNYTQFKYEKQKEARQKKAHAKRVEVKGIRLSYRIGAHDLETRRKQAQAFLENGQKVQIEIVLRGRERAHVAASEKIMHNFYESLKEILPVKIEQPFSKQGGRLTMLIARE